MKLMTMVTGLVVGLALSGVQAFGQERFRTLDFTNAAFTVPYVGTNAVYPTVSNQAGALIQGSNAVPLAPISANGTTANWFNIQDWYNTPVTFSAGVSLGGSATSTNGNVTFQLNLATDLGDTGNPPQPGIAPVPPTVVSNAWYFVVPAVAGITNFATTNVPLGFFTNYHWACWAAIINNTTNTWTTNSAGIETNCVRVQKFRAQWFR